MSAGAGEELSKHSIPAADVGGLLARFAELQQSGRTGCSHGLKQPQMKNGLVRLSPPPSNAGTWCSCLTATEGEVDLARRQVVEWARTWMLDDRFDGSQPQHDFPPPSWIGGQGTSA